MDEPAKILVADDDRTIRRNLVLLLKAEGYATLDAADGASALDLIRSESPDAVLLDLKMPGLDGLEVLAALGPAALVDLPVIVVTAFGGSAPAIEAMRRGAYDYLTKPFDLDEVLLTLKRALRQRSLEREVRALRAKSPEPAEEVDGPDAEPELVGTSPAMREVFKAIGRVSATDAAVLIVGESGTGKELVASALHRHSPRASGPFLRVNCGALPEGLIESELFGHEKGAFTGADRMRPGRFERAQGGTIFLDEVGELPLSAQAKLLRVLQQREFERVGGTETLRADSRVIAATHRDLPKEVAAGTFREDLFYRLNVARIAIPPLRDRPEDIDLLADHILRGLGRRFGWDGLSLAPEALAAAPVASLAGERPPARERPGPRRDRLARPRHPPRAPRPRHPARLSIHLGRPGRRPAPACRPGRRRAPRDPPRLARHRRQPDEGRRAPRHQPPPALRQDPRIRHPRLNTILRISPIRRCSRPPRPFGEKEGRVSLDLLEPRPHRPRRPTDRGRSPRDFPGAATYRPGRPGRNAT